MSMKSNRFPDIIQIEKLINKEFCSFLSMYVAIYRFQLKLVRDFKLKPKTFYLTSLCPLHKYRPNVKFLFNIDLNSVS